MGRGGGGRVVTRTVLGCVCGGGSLGSKLQGSDKAGKCVTNVDNQDPEVSPRFGDT